jgi:predicted neuraminidase
VRAALLLAAACVGRAQFETGVVKASDGGQFHRNTIPQVARMEDGRLLCVFGAYARNSGDGRIYGMLSPDNGRTWAAQTMLIDEPNLNDGDANILVDGPVVSVYAGRTDNPNTISRMRVFMTRSLDNGNTWVAPVEIHVPRQYFPGKQHDAIKLFDGTYLMGISWDLWPERGMRARTEGEMVLASGAMLSRDGIQWTLHGNLTTFQPKVTPGATNGLCEPSVVQLATGEILMYLRSGTSRHWESRSSDNGATWTEPRPGPLVGHNTPTALWRVEDSPLVVAVWNNSPVNRYPLSAASSKDGGRTWTQPRIIANSRGPQVSYPGITQAADGKLVVVWQQQKDDGSRDIRWARFAPEWIATGK